MLKPLQKGIIYCAVVKIRTTVITLKISALCSRGVFKHICWSWLWA